MLIGQNRYLTVTVAANLGENFQVDDQDLVWTDLCYVTVLSNCVDNFPSTTFPLICEMEAYLVAQCRWTTRDC